ncbi:MAG: polymer-forming cytoskeletal protein [Candidatus Eisenbacteria bacterium]
MFGLKKEGAAEGKLNCIIGGESAFRGEMSVRGSARIDGEFEGHVLASEALFVGKTGVVKADVEAKDVMIAGTLIGNLKGAERVELHSGAHVEGDIETRSLVVGEGVFFNGKCTMAGEVQEMPLAQVAHETRQVSS